MIKKRKGGARRKSAHGLDHVLYVRIDKRLQAALERLREREERRTRGRTVSTGDVVRMALWTAIEADNRFP